jgi:peptide chain release factor subunit 1
VLEALSHAIGKLKTTKKIPENGLVIFSSESSCELIEPPKEIRSPIYRCSNEFFLQPLQEMLRNEDTIAVIAIDATECGIGIIDGDRWYILDTLTSGVGGKSNQGGSSFRRYERDREAKLNMYYHRVAEHANRLLLNTTLAPRSLVISGPAFTKEDFVKKEYLDYRLRQKLAKMVGTEYAGLEGVVQTFNILKQAL